MLSRELTAYLRYHIRPRAEKIMLARQNCITPITLLLYS